MDKQKAGSIHLLFGLLSLVLAFSVIVGFDRSEIGSHRSVMFSSVGSECDNDGDRWADDTVECVEGD